MTRLLLLLPVLFALPAAAQTDAPETTPAPPPAFEAWLHVETGTPDAIVTLDGAALGPASEGPFRVEPGAHRVALVDGTAWDARRDEADATLALGDTLALALALPVRTRIESLPLRATVVHVNESGQEKVLGTTPLVIDQPVGTGGRFVARMEGYSDAEAAAPESGGRVSLVLTPEALDASETAAYVLPTQRRNTTRVLLDVGLGASALAAGALAVHYKFQADRLDDAYRLSGSLSRGEESLRQDSVEFDRLSAIALTASTASLGILAIRLAIR